MEREAIPNATISDFEKLAKDVAAQRAVCAEIRSKLKEEDSKLDSIEAIVIATLEANEKTGYDAQAGRFGISHRTSVTLPKDEDRKQFFDFLKRLGIFEDMITVNSNTLNAWYKAEEKRAEEEDRLLDFSIPGITGVTTRQILSFTKKN